ncbi:MAG: hypothetical protein ACE5JL_18930, partial [Dehalococcoidia bacterium]
MKEELSVFYDDDKAFHVHGYPSAVTCQKCGWEYNFEYTCLACFEEAIEAEATENVGDHEEATEEGIEANS